MKWLKWNNVEDCLPDTYELKLITLVCKDGQKVTTVGWYSIDGWKRLWADSMSYLIDGERVTHWADFPAPAPLGWTEESGYRFRPVMVALRLGENLPTTAITGAALRNLFQSWDGHNCDVCPYAQPWEYPSHEHPLPCGQQNCWTDCANRDGND